MARGSGPNQSGPNHSKLSWTLLYNKIDCILETLQVWFGPLTKKKEVWFWPRLDFDVIKSISSLYQICSMHSFNFKIISHFDLFENIFHTIKKFILNQNSYFVPSATLCWLYSTTFSCQIKFYGFGIGSLLPVI